MEMRTPAQRELIGNERRVIWNRGSDEGSFINKCSTFPSSRNDGGCSSHEKDGYDKLAENCLVVWDCYSHGARLCHWDVSDGTVRRRGDDGTATATVFNRYSLQPIGGGGLGCDKENGNNKLFRVCVCVFPQRCDNENLSRDVREYKNENVNSFQSRVYCDNIIIIDSRESDLTDTTGDDEVFDCVYSRSSINSCLRCGELNQLPRNVGSITCRKRCYFNNLCEKKIAKRNSINYCVINQNASKSSLGNIYSPWPPKSICIRKNKQTHGTPNRNSFRTSHGNGDYTHKGNKQEKKLSLKFSFVKRICKVGSKLHFKAKRNWKILCSSNNFKNKFKAELYKTTNLNKIFEFENRLIQSGTKLNCISGYHVHRHSSHFNNKDKNKLSTFETNTGNIFGHHPTLSHKPHLGDIISRQSRQVRSSSFSSSSSSSASSSSSPATNDCPLFPGPTNNNTVATPQYWQSVNLSSPTQAGRSVTTPPPDQDNNTVIVLGGPLRPARPHSSAWPHTTMPSSTNPHPPPPPPPPPSSSSLPQPPLPHPSEQQQELRLGLLTSSANYTNRNTLSMRDRTQTVSSSDRSSANRANADRHHDIDSTDFSQDKKDGDGGALERTRADGGYSGSGYEKERDINIGDKGGKKKSFGEENTDIEVGNHRDFDGGVISENKTTTVYVGDKDKERGGGIGGGGLDLETTWLPVEEKAEGEGMEKGLGGKEVVMASTVKTNLSDNNVTEVEVDARRNSGTGSSVGRDNIYSLLDVRSSVAGSSSVAKDAQSGERGGDICSKDNQDIVVNSDVTDVDIEINDEKTISDDNESVLEVTDKTIPVKGTSYTKVNITIGDCFNTTGGNENKYSNSSGDNNNTTHNDITSSKEIDNKVGGNVIKSNSRSELETDLQGKGSSHIGSINTNKSSVILLSDAETVKYKKNSNISLSDEVTDRNIPLVSKCNQPSKSIEKTNAENVNGKKDGKEGREIDTGEGIELQVDIEDKHTKRGRLSTVYANYPDNKNIDTGSRNNTEQSNNSVFSTTDDDKDNTGHFLASNSALCCDGGVQQRTIRDVNRPNVGASNPHRLSHQYLNSTCFVPGAGNTFVDFSNSNSNTTGMIFTSTTTPSDANCMEKPLRQTQDFKEMPLNSHHRHCREDTKLLSSPKRNSFVNSNNMGSGVGGTILAPKNHHYYNCSADVFQPVTISSLNIPISNGNGKGRDFQHDHHVHLNTPNNATPQSREYLCDMSKYYPTFDPSINSVVQKPLAVKAYSSQNSPVTFQHNPSHSLGPYYNQNHSFCDQCQCFTPSSDQVVSHSHFIPYHQQQQHHFYQLRQQSTNHHHKLQQQHPHQLPHPAISSNHSFSPYNPDWWTTDLNFVCIKHKFSFTPIALLWTILSMLISASCLMSFLTPYWMIHPDHTHTFGLINLCIADPHASRIRPLCVRYGEQHFQYTYPTHHHHNSNNNKNNLIFLNGGLQNTGSAASFEQIPSRSWRAACLLFGAGCCLHLIGTVGAALTLLVLREPWRRHVTKMIGYMQAVAVVLLFLGIIVYPGGFDSPLYSYYCHSSGDSYNGGQCSMGWSYITAIVATALSIFCPVLAWLGLPEIKQGTSYKEYT